ncbi:SLAM family member 6-like [Phyllobates terribilis]|uniref:SLAM family member 6-like n=1 Tax=Phyllobates terribilis TaxID=111132 RepID=UPI003CCB4732
MRLLQVLCTVLITILYSRPTLCSDVCSGVLNIPATEGENIILPINETEVKEISWILGGYHIVTTKPGNECSVKNRRLIERLQGTDQGSLKINDVRMEDQGEYSATVFKQKNNHCLQHFQVKIYPKLLNEDVEIKIKVSENKSCIFTCSVNNSDVTIFWSYQSERNTNIRNPTLKLYDINPNSTYTCVAENPANRISRSIKPWILCQKETDYSLVNQANRANRVPTVVMIMCVLKVVLCQ